MKIGTLFDIELYINKLLIVMLALFVAMGNGRRVATIFLAIFIHELAHVATARMLGLHAKRIEIYPFGGAIKLDSPLELNPFQEIMVSIAGPIVNILVATIYIALDSRFDLGVNEQFIRANLMLACFNILPALPLDGGRVVRSLLSKEMGIKNATRLMANGGIVLSIFLIASGIYALFNGIFNITIFFIAGFLIFSSIDEKRTAAYAAFRDISNKRDNLFKKGSMEIRHMAVVEDTPLTEIVAKFIPYRYHYINIVDYKMERKGSVSESQVMDGMVRFGTNITIGNLLKRIRE